MKAEVRRALEFDPRGVRCVVELPLSPAEEAFMLDVRALDRS